MNFDVIAQVSNFLFSFTWCFIYFFSFFYSSLLFSCHFLILYNTPLAKSNGNEWSKNKLWRLHLGSCLNHVEFSIPYHTFNVLRRSIELLNCTSCTSNAGESWVLKVCINQQRIRWVIKHNFLFFVYWNTARREILGQWKIKDKLIWVWYCSQPGQSTICSAQAYHWFWTK